MNRVANTPRTFSFILLCSLIALATSFLAQYSWGYQPCLLCKLQRLPYLFLGVVSTWAIIFPKSRKWLSFILLIVIAMGLLLSLYHLGIQLGILKDRCSMKISIQSIESFGQHLVQKKPCSEISLSIFGVPISGLNSLFFLIFGIVRLSKKFEKRSSKSTYGRC